jgi:triacylglycerol esterase/lipase EstA (alpha/beta hydrolase family)
VAANERTAVLFVHGLWMTGIESFALRLHLVQSRGWQWRNFFYSSVIGKSADVARELDRTVREIDADQVHLVGHSLGGLIIHATISGTMEYELAWPPGRVVFLGTPSMGSHAAERFKALPLGALILGQAAESLLSDTPRTWHSRRQLGIIAGSSGMSLGRILTRYSDDETNDGTVSVSETRLPGATAHITMNESHTGMLFSATVAEQVAAFLASGAFSTADADADAG